MADAPRDFDVPEAAASPKRRWSLSLVWLIPIVAVVIGGWLAVKAIQERGPTITITFKTAEGLEAGKTKLKYKYVDVGVVKEIALNKDRSGVTVTVDLVKGTERALVEDTRFWVVRARVGTGGVSGLGTLFSGAYLGVDIGKSTKPRRDFTGLETPPIVTGETPGRQFVVRSQNLGSLDIGSPLYFRRVPVGEVVAHSLDQDGTGVTLKVFVDAPYDQYVTKNSRFWNASGIDVTVDASGIKVETQSLVSILAGGIAFETPTESSTDPPAEMDTVFTLFSDRKAAMARPDVEVFPAVLYFSESLRGLSPGAPVDFNGIILGEVTDITAEFNPATKMLRFPVAIVLYPERMRARSRGTLSQPTPEEQRARMDMLIAAGVRAQLKTGNLLTGQLYVAFDFFPNSPKTKIDWTKTPPEFPTVPGGLVELQVTLHRIAKQIDKLPLGQISSDLRFALQSLNRTLESTNALVKQLDKDVAPVARGALEDARRALQTAERTLGAEAPLQHDMREALRELTRAAQTLRVLGDFFERHPEALIRGKKEDEP
jgi:paraquat-inducible protein B